MVDSFDTHARIPEHFAAVDQAAKATGHIGIISVGWDPGLFSLARVYSNAILPAGKDYTFWGKGVSQGHSDAIRRIAGVKNAKQYTIPVESALAAVRSGANPQLTTRQKHTRECFVVLEDGADAARVEQEIKTMPARPPKIKSRLLMISTTFCLSLFLRFILYLGASYRSRFFYRGTTVKCNRNFYRSFIFRAGTPPTMQLSGIS